MDKLLRIFGREKNYYNETYLVSHNGHLYSSSHTNIQKWEDDKCVKILAGHFSLILCLFSHNNYLYSGSYDGSIIKWENDEFVQYLEGHTESVICIISHNNFIYSCSWDATIRKWDENGKCGNILQIENEQAFYSLASCNEYLYSCGEFGVYKYKNDKCIKTILLNDAVFCMTPYNNLIYVGLWGGVIKKFDINNDHEYEQILPEKLDATDVNELIIHDCCLFSVFADKTIKKWNNDKCVQNWKFNSKSTSMTI